MIILSYVSIEQLKKDGACFALDYLEANPGWTLEDVMNEPFDGRRGGGTGMIIWLAVRYPVFRKEVRRLIKGKKEWEKVLSREIKSHGK